MVSGSQGAVRNMFDDGEDLDEINDFVFDVEEEGAFVERALLSVDTLEQLFIRLNESGTIMNVLDEIADSRTRQDNLVNLAASVLKSNNSALGSLGINVNINATTLLLTVLESGLIQGTAHELFFVEENFQKLTAFVGHGMSRNAWVAKLLYEMGEGSTLTVDYIADIIRNTKTKNPNYLYLNEELNSKQVYLHARAEDYNGTAQEFFSNLIGSVIGSNIALSTIGDVLTALNRSGIVVPTLFQVLDNEAVLNATQYMIGLLYDKGAFDKIDLPASIQEAKDKHLISDGLNFILTDPVYEPVAARFFNTLRISGVFEDIKLNLYGP